MLFSENKTEVTEVLYFYMNFETQSSIKFTLDFQKTY